MPDDWRLQNQMDFLRNVELVWKEYKAPSESWDHDHCEFCWAEFMEAAGPEYLRAGYCTEDEYRWICKQCFENFKAMFAWTVKNS
ncbi:MAG: hypothetical protein IT426_05610 [Pirellulales bacterium]|nr:hypothetical protein [Pirellulales bacterium]